ncbi:helix-turn-helix domain-containing protein [Streptomyces asoensis]|uniref:helix-turn-helix domain-containing protein n=1 Tax=Streptomyces TaxID=1883 RepID=UPI00190D5214|nr:helix-turn-helix transcriptional regulator [Streptomyces sp. MBT97]MBK3631617.1 helix-turn-helix transcriptional regulator [Streptomyces sp. MBT97]
MRPHGQAIRAWRLARNLSIRQVETLTGMNRGYLSRLERGQIRTTSESRIQRVATVLDIDPDLLELKEKKP